MTKVDIFSGFLGAGKTTLIKKLIAEAYPSEKLVLIENEFGEIGIDGGFLENSGIEITEITSGCICCSLIGNFKEALAEVREKYNPDRILIEPSGVGKLSDVIDAVKSIGGDLGIGSCVTIVNALKFEMYLKNFGDFFTNQIEYAGTVVFSRTATVSPDALSACIKLVRKYNEGAAIITTPWDKLPGIQIRETIESKDTLQSALTALETSCSDTCPDCGHHHVAHDEHCDCGHDHHHHDEHCDCGCHNHEHNHNANDVFSSWGTETARTYSEREITEILKQLDDDAGFGTVLRAKGIVESENGSWIHFDYVPGESSVVAAPAGVTGRICVIGTNLNIPATSKLFDA